VWDAPRLAEFLLDPEDLYPGIWMGGNVPRRPEERAAVLRYLQTLR
jgi:cytochrome c